MKKIFIFTLVSALLVAMTVAGTVAYLTSTDAKDNAVAGGKASIELVEFKREDVSKKNGDEKLVKFASDDKHVLIPASGSNYSTPYHVSFDEAHVGEKMKINGVNTDSYTVNLWNHAALTNEIDKMVFVKNTGDTDVYVRICFAFEAGNYVWKSHFDKMVHLNKNDNANEWTWDWGDGKVVEINGTRYFIAWATYQKPVAPDEYTKISLSQIALDSSALNDHVRAFGDSYDVKAFAQGVQADSAMTADTALKNTFGDKIPFDNAKKVSFVDLKTALHYLNGENYDANKITSNVTSVTFGLTKDHSAKVEGYNGVLVANKVNEADFTAYAYYVPTTDGKNYNIYVLADNWKIYAPKSSKWLFSGMSALTKADTKNLDFSYVTNMEGVFLGCGVLEELDVSDWNVTKKVSDISNMFYSCSALTTLDCSNWDVSGVTNMQYAFYGCKGLTNLDVSYWEVGKVSSFWNTFLNCSNLTTIPVDTWTWDGDPGQNPTVDMRCMFSGCTSLTALDLSGWDVGKVTKMDNMFYNCTSLTSVNVGGWNVGNVSTIAYMFYNCTSLTSVNVGGWNVGNVSTIAYMFYNCYKLSDLDLSSWNVSSVTNMAGMFSYCKALESLNVSTWNVSAVTDMSNMFEMCQKLVELDLSGWDTTNLVNTEKMFSGCGRLKTIYVSEYWNMGNVTSSGSMFENCYDLVGGSSGKTYYATQVNATYANYENGYLTKKK